MKSKLKRFEIIATRDNVLEPGKEIYLNIKGNWKSLYFKNNNPITVELACGRGEYSVGMARQFLNRNFIGVDKKGDRLWKGSTWAVEDQLSNVGFLRTEILFLESFFEAGEIDELWLTFPDPRPRKRDIKRRLSSSRYLEMYKKVLKPGGYFRFKTDNTDLFNFTLEELSLRSDLEDFESTHDLYASPLRPECYDIKTRYEEMFAAQGEKIKYLRFRFRH
ncbi:MAG: tRNA (guanosine(46)-N7)-methyltransferase TrmB [Cyclobacteriaceae bacterium]|nr:tRNA (guanosine(46)-N7)-methyltransferase TrmB [Cyclobacteriaceae bacterium]